MDHTGSPGGRADPSPQGPLSLADAESLLQRADGYHTTIVKGQVT